MENERRVQLTDDQYERLWKDCRARDLIGRTIANLVVEAAKQQAELEHDYWDTIHRLAEADPIKQKVQVDFINRCLVVGDEPAYRPNEE